MRLLDMGETLLTAAVAFGKHFAGVITRPYETYRKIVDRGHAAELIYIGLLLLVYFALAAIVKSTSFRPYLLTRAFVVLVTATAATYLLSVGLLWKVSTWFGGKGTTTGVALGWAYTLIPTWMWFMVTSVLYVLIPPPRTTSIPGIIFSVLYLVFSIVMLFWKLILGYLTLRFGMRMTVGNIVATAAVVLPILVLYSLCMYWWGIFKIPFI